MKFTERRIPTWGWAVLFGLAYFALAEIGRWLSEPAYAGGFATAWPPSGLYVAALYLARRRAGWFVLSAFIAYLCDVCLIHQRDLATSLAFFLADSGEAGIGAWGLYAVCGPQIQMTRLRDVLALVGIAGVLAPAMGASLGTPAAFVGSSATYDRMWCTWWVVDALGVLLVAPVILSWPQFRWPALRESRAARRIEFALLLTGLAFLTAVTLQAQPGRLLSVPYPVLPFLVWAALRFGPLETSLAFVVMSVSSFWYATQGPGAAVTRLDDLLQVELFLSVVDISFLILAGVTAERRTIARILSRNQVLLRAIYKSQADFIGGRSLSAVLGRLLDETQPVTGCTLGLAGALRQAGAGGHAVLLLAVRDNGPAPTDVPAVDQALRDLIEQVGRTGQPIVSRGIALQNGGLDGNRFSGNQSGTADFVALPCHHLGKVMGVLGLVFEPGQYDPTLAPLIPQLLLTCGHLIESDRQNALRKLAEESLAERERDLADFFDNAPVGLHWIGPDGRILRVNQAELELLGYSRDEFVGRHVTEFHEDPGIARTMLRQMHNGEDFQNVEVRLRARDGSLRHVEVSANAFRQANRVVRTRCIMRDVTGRQGNSH
jgi:PAS domain S-box-containing protein